MNVKEEPLCLKIYVKAEVSSRIPCQKKNLFFECWRTYCDFSLESNTLGSDEIMNAICGGEDMMVRKGTLFRGV